MPSSAIFPDPGFRGIRNAQRRDGRLLHETRQAEQHALRHRLRVNHHLRRTHQPARTPARHGMRLGKTADGHHLVGQFRGQARNSAARRQSRVHFVRHHPQRMPARQIADHRQFGCAQDDAARIVRRREKQRPRTRRDRRLELLQVHAETSRRRCRDPHHPRAGYLERGRVARVQGLERNHLVAGCRNTQRGHEQRILRPGEKDDVGGVDLLAGPCMV